LSIDISAQFPQTFDALRLDTLTRQMLVADPLLAVKIRHQGLKIFLFHLLVFRVPGGAPDVP